MPLCRSRHANGNSRLVQVLPCGRQDLFRRDGVDQVGVAVEIVEAESVVLDAQEEIGDAVIALESERDGTGQEAFGVIELLIGHGFRAEAGQLGADAGDGLLDVLRIDAGASGPHAAGAAGIDL